MKIAHSLLLSFIIACSIKSTLQQPKVEATITELTQDNFEEFTKDQPANVASFIMFGADWCGHCRQFKNDMFQDFANAVTEVQGHAYDVKFYYHMHQSGASKIFDQFRVNSFPTLFIINDNQVYQYKGRRSIESLVTFTQEFSTGEGSEYPAPATAISKVTGIFVQVWEEILYEYKKNPKNTLFIGGIFLALLILTPIITCVVTDRIMEKRFQKERQQNIEARNRAVNQQKQAQQDVNDGPGKVDDTQSHPEGKEKAE